MKATKRPPDNVIRVGDRVVVVIPRVVVRVGYPKTVDDYLPEAERLFKGSGELAQTITGAPRYIHDKLVRQIAYSLANGDGFGGRDRTIHLRYENGIEGLSFEIESVRSAMTGRYYAAQTSTSYYGEDDYEPGGLDGMKYNRIARLYCLHLELPVEHLRKVHG